MRITAACPEGLIDDANSLAMIWGPGPGDGQTYRNAQWVDAEGHMYAVASWEAEDTWRALIEVAANEEALEALRPDWDDRAMIDVQAAARAQAALVVWEPVEPLTELPLAQPGKLVVIVALGGAEALGVLGLSRHVAP